MIIIIIIKKMIIIKAWIIIKGLEQRKELRAHVLQ